MTGRLKNNSGYSLVELIIVLGIIAVLSGLAAVTISSISTARASASRNHLMKNCPTCRQEQKRRIVSLRFRLRRLTESTILSMAKSVNGTDFTEDATIDRVILDRVTIYYSADASSTGSELSTPAIIKFNKSDGSVVVGNAFIHSAKKARPIPLERLL